MKPIFRWLPIAGSLLGAIALLSACGDKGAFADRPGRGPLKSPAQRYEYRLKVGETRHFQVTGLFVGHIPPFSRPPSPPVTVLIELTYTTRVRSVESSGASISFTADSATVSLLEKDPGPSLKVNPDDKIELSLPLNQVQKALNVNALIRPDGSIVKIDGGDTSSVKVDLGFDLRKLFLLLMPVTFADKPVAEGDAWTYKDGLLGNSERVTYNAALKSAQTSMSRNFITVDLSGNSSIADFRDKEGKVVSEAESVDSTTGKVTLTGAVQLQEALPSAPGACRLVVSGSKLNLTADITHKRTVADPNHPEDPLESTIDLKARLLVKPIKPSAGTASGATHKTGK